jgi:hypothetical protein
VGPPRKPDWSRGAIIGATVAVLAILTVVVVVAVFVVQSFQKSLGKAVGRAVQAIDQDARNGPKIAFTTDPETGHHTLLVMVCKGQAVQRVTERTGMTERSVAALPAASLTELKDPSPSPEGRVIALDLQPLEALSPAPASPAPPSAAPNSVTVKLGTNTLAEPLPGRWPTANQISVGGKYLTAAAFQTRLNAYSLLVCANPTSS